MRPLSPRAEWPAEGVWKALSEPRRRAILEVLLDQGPLAVGVIAEQVVVTQQAASQHLRVLEEAGLVEARRQGTRHLYSVCPAGFRPLTTYASAFWSARLRALKEAAEE